MSENYILNNGVEMPKVGLGVYKIQEDQADSIVYALQNGYKSLDTASFYHNEEMIASAIKKSGIDRKNIFLTTKVWNSDHGKKKTKKAFEESLKRLNTDYIDLYLIHWPSPKYIESWKAIEELYKEGKIRAIGVANFEQKHLEKLEKFSTVTPAVNQIQTNPFKQQEQLHWYLKNKGILHEAWGPFGHGNQSLFNNEVLIEISKKYGKTPAQVILRWNLDREIAVIPKSVSPKRLDQNLDVFDFSLTNEEMKKIATLEQNTRGFNDPNNKLFLWITQFIN
ncbi:2,5-diketo-D-gluconic acid reductase [Lactiplantibacillus plantarum EGD-AQ4]|nr:aldo/keto reductase [Lactiplantibacillus pentosus]EIW15255.1 Aldo/keto reductase, related to diketogulonate reductase [Lactiplantibacillus pentosus KCA1]EQM54737.1 2,5-diketo-D-gluconic acid reductase [Lactiplantibacillus plantarum EGD-AQ4]